MNVEDWLRGLGLGQYEALFRENDIDVEVLPELTEADFEKVGVSLGHRKRLLKAIAGLKIPFDEPSATSTMMSGPTADAAERRQLTVMFCDLVGSTALSARLDPEDLRSVIGTYHRCCAEGIERNGGFVAKYMGDGVLAYFGYPRASEHDAERAVRSGLALVEALPKSKTVAGVPLQVRIGIATGLVVVGDLLGAGSAQEQAVVGETPNLAARLQAIAEPGAVVIASSTHRLTGGLFEYRDLGAFTLKGFAEDIPAWQALREGAAEGRFEALHGTTTPLVGRDEEIELLLRRWAETKNGEGCVVLVSGEPGIGKSRLVQTLLERVSGEPHSRMRYFCSPHHQNSALYPAITQLERAAGFRREDTPEQKLTKLEAVLALGTNDLGEAVPLLADLLGIPTGDRYPSLALTPQKQKEKTLHAMLMQVEGLATRQPVLMAFEDIHWSDPSTRESLDLLIDRVPTLGVLLILTFRPEFIPPWLGRPHVSVLNLSRLTPKRRAEMIARVTGGKRLPKEILDQIVERTDGVPLFIEELTKTIIESGIVTEGGESYSVAAHGTPLAIPTTLQGSLLARLDRLAPTREVAQIAAALGRQFSHELISAVTPIRQQQLDNALAQLVSAELLFQRGEVPDAEYTFKHALVQEAAYGTLLRSQRHLINGRIVGALEERFPEIVKSQPEKLAHHCGEAGQFEKAVDYFLAAGGRALARSAMEEAASHAKNGIELSCRLPEGAARQYQELGLQICLGQAQSTTRGYGAQEPLEAFMRARELCAQIGRPPHLVPVIWGLWQVRLLRYELDIAEQLAQEMRRLGEEDKNSTLIFFACHMSGINHFELGDFSRARGYFEEGLRNPTAAVGAEHPVVGSLMWLAASLYLLGHLDKSRARYDEAWSEARKSNPFSLALGLLIGMTLPLNVRDADSMESLANELLVLAREHGFLLHEAYGSIFHGWSVAVRGRPNEGIAEIIAGVTTLQRSLMTPVTGIVLLADAYGIAGQPEEGMKLLTDAKYAPDWHGELPTVLVHRVLSTLHLLAADSAAAESQLRQAITLAQAQDAKFLELLAAVDLARLWASQGKRAQAHDLLAPIHGWFTEGHDTPILKEAKALLEELP
jgi:class 3 adenylate cyclase/tetratricopeptide (TPR) repeat protein